jgi:hypothetical protein
MMAEIDLESIEKKAYLAYHRDGIWDIFLGLFFLSTGIFMIYDQAYLMGAAPVIFYFAAFGLKRSFTRSRLGFVKFSRERQAREKQGRVKLSILLTITMLLGIVAFYAYTGDAGWQVWIRSLGLVSFGFVVALILSAVAILFGIWRFFFYALLILALFIAGHQLNSDPAAYFLSSGIIILLIGLVMLIAFIRKYPKPSSEDLTGDIYRQ